MPCGKMEDVLLTCLNSFNEAAPCVCKAGVTGQRWLCNSATLRNVGTVHKLQNDIAISSFHLVCKECFHISMKAFLEYEGILMQYEGPTGTALKQCVV